MYRRILKYLTPYKKEFLLALFCMVLFGASDGVIPFLVKYILDGVFARQDTSLLYVLPVLLILFALFRAVCSFGQEYLMGKVGHSIVRDIRNDLNKNLLRLSPDYFIRSSTANIISRITSDVILVRSLLTDSVASIIRDTIRIVALVGAALYFDLYLALIALIAFPIGIYPVLRIGKKLRRLSRRGQDSIGSISSMLQESILGNRVVKIFGREKFEEKRFEDENEDLTRTFIKSERTRAITAPINEVLASFAISGVILYGGLTVIGGTRTQGDFIAFLFSVFLLYDPFKKLSRVQNSVQLGLGASERIFEVLDEKPKIYSPLFPIPLTESNTIVFDNVSYAYDGSEEEAVSDVDITVLEGSKVAVVGFSGAGKSTLIDLIPRFIDPKRGAVKIGGVDISKVSLSDLRSRIALVGQHTFLFNDTIYSNIAYGNEDASKESIELAARSAFAYDFIMRLPNGFNTVIGEGGFALSGGERQRIAIARAILKNAPILILDEATASLDSRSEREVQSAIEALEKGRTSVVIAHRLSTVLDADLIVVMKGGRVVEQGTHEELVSNKGEYEKLYNMQFTKRQEADSNLSQAVASSLG